MFRCTTMPTTSEIRLGRAHTSVFLKLPSDPSVEPSLNTDATELRNMCPLQLKVSFLLLLKKLLPFSSLPLLVSPREASENQLVLK